MAPIYLWPVTLTGYAILINFLIFEKSKKQIFLKTFLFFFGFHICGLYWVSSSLFVDFETWWWALPFSLIGLPLFCALHPSLFALLTAWLPKFKWLGYCAAFAFADWVRAYTFTGFPWNFPIHGMVNNVVMFMLPMIGFYALNASIIFVAGLMTLNRKFCMIIFLLLVSIWFVPLSIMVNKSNSPPNNTVLVQANIAQKDKWDPDQVLQHLNTYILMSQAAVKKDEPHIIIWPETVLSQNLLSYPPAKIMMNGFLESLPENSLLVSGYLNHHNDKNYNSLIVKNKSFESFSKYDKHHLVPFGEYMPFGIDTITGFKGFSSGDLPKPINVGSENVFPLICYEIIFPRYMKSDNNYDYILNITNDSWFGKTAGPYQHMDQARLRAIEFQKPVLRLSGNGISGWIETNGLIRNQMALDTKKTVILNSF
jgi:apolipoprotein N-acyltransferase